jgi:hypothetical protein
MNQFKNKAEQIFLAAGVLIFMLVPLVYFTRFGNYVFFFQEKSSLFLFSSDYLSEHLIQPGGFLIWLGKLFTVFYYHKILAAVLLLLLVLMTMMLVMLISKDISRRRNYTLPLLTGALLIYLHAQYYYIVMNSIGILLQLLLFCISTRLLKGKLLWLPIILFPLWYFLTGSFSMVFAVMFSIWLLMQNYKTAGVKISGLLLVMIITFLVSKEFIFYHTPETLLMYPFSIQDTGMQAYEFGVLVALISLLPLLSGIKLLKHKIKKSRNLNTGLLIPPVTSIVLILMLTQQYNSNDKHYFHVEELFYEGKYEEIIAYNRKFPSTNKLTLFLNNIALAETGQLSERLFEFPQSADGSTLALNWEISGEVLKRGGYFYYALGMVNEANRWAYEYMVMRGLTPEGLKIMVKTELINGHFKVAEKYTRLLKQALFYRKDAKTFEKLLYNEALVDAHPELGSKRRLKPSKDFFVIADKPVVNLIYLSAANPGHRASLEYQIAYLLLMKDPEAVVKLLPLIEKAGYKKIPKPVEEAIMIYAQTNNGNFPDLQYLNIHQKTIDNFNRFGGIMQQNSSSREQAQRALHREFSGTYWYYLLFR